MIRLKPGVLLLISLAGLMLVVQAACLIGGQAGEAPAGPEEKSGPVEQTAVLQEEVNPEEVFEEAELPEGFPPDFPIPEGARVGSSVNLPGEDNFRVFIALPGTLEEALAFYRAELPAAGWEVVQDQEASGGTRLEVLGSAYKGELLFIPADTGVALDVSLTPLQAQADQPDLPDLPEGLGESTTLGEAAGNLPEDLPIPASYHPVPLSTQLEGQGYLLAYGFSGPPELALVDLTMALTNGGWEVGEPSLDTGSRSYRVPFTDPDSGWSGCALISGDPASFGVEAPAAALVAYGPSCP
jgi:hypothetical protein